MKSLFVTGTDTDVGKTVISAGLARAISDRGIDIGVMKPFASGTPRQSGFRSEDVQTLARAARVSDPEVLINPQFFPIFASPYTALETLGIKPDVKLVLEKFKELRQIHEMLIVEGIGGVLTPILRDYCIADLIHDMGLEGIIIAQNRIGTINHTVLTCMACKKYGIKIAGIIINDFTIGYPVDELQRDIKALTKVDVLGVVPRLESFDADSAANVITRAVDLDLILDS